MGYNFTITTFKKRTHKVSGQTNATQTAIDSRQYFDQCKSLIDDALDQYLKTRVPQIPPLLHQAMCYSVLDAGKRFRPTLTLAVGELFGAKRAPMLSFACAIELFIATR